MSHINLVVEDILVAISKSKNKILGSREVRKMIEKILGEDASPTDITEIRERLIASGKVDYFKEGDYIHESKFYWSAGNWYSAKGVYSNPIEAKFKMGLSSWQRFVGDEANHLDIS